MMRSRLFATSLTHQRKAGLHSILLLITYSDNSIGFEAFRYFSVTQDVDPFPTTFAVYIQPWSSWVNCFHFSTWWIFHWLELHCHWNSGQLSLSISGSGVVTFSINLWEQRSRNLVIIQFMIGTIKETHFVLLSVKKWVCVEFTYALSVDTLPTL